MPYLPIQGRYGISYGLQWLGYWQHSAGLGSLQGANHFYFTKIFRKAMGSKEPSIQRTPQICSCDQTTGAWIWQLISRGEVKKEWSWASIPSRRGQGQLCLLHLCTIYLTLYTLSYRISIPMWGKSILGETTSLQTPTNIRLLSDGLKWPQCDG